ncbi:MAG: hypothetical protein ACRDBG_26700 [Waterburya sp.]
MKKSKLERKFQFLHAVAITLGLFLFNQPISEQSQDNFQQISLAVSQDLMAYLIE